MHTLLKGQSLLVERIAEIKAGILFRVVFGSFLDGFCLA
jgi:hypothetical protein